MSVKTSINQVTSDLTQMRFLFTNMYFLQTPDGWVLIDAGLQGCADDVVKAAEERFGAGVPPRAIVMTHGHFDHVGAFPEIFEQWDVPVYAHPIEVPHLTGQKDYVEPDPTVGKGGMALMSFAYPNKAIDLGERVRALSDDGSIPVMPGWRWIHTPGHTDGHTAFFRDTDRLLIAGDAFVTVEQESIYKVATQKQEVHGPPAYFTPDWPTARRSVEALAALRPAIAATGHGTPMEGEALAQGLAHILEHWDDEVVPDQGRYVPEDQSAT